MKGLSVKALEVYFDQLRITFNPYTALITKDSFNVDHLTPRFIHADESCSKE